MIEAAIEKGHLIHDWGGYDFGKRQIKVFDTTLRDGDQGGFPHRQSSISEKLCFVDAAAELGINALEIGFPISSHNHKEEVIAVAKHVVERGYPIVLSCLTRTTSVDIEVVAEVAQRAGTEVTANILSKTSEIQRVAQGWSLQEIEKWIRSSIRLAKKHNLPVEFVAEDVSRATPDMLKFMYGIAIEEGVQGIWMTDTVGVATPNGARKITQFFKNEIVGNQPLTLDWHGHDDKDLGVANSLSAAEAGADRIQGTALGIGERVGNTPLEPVILELVLSGAGKYDLTKLLSYSRKAAQMFGIEMRDNYPVIGEYAHGTQAGIHAATIEKYEKMGRPDLAAVVYEPYDPELVGSKEKILIGPRSGKANIELTLRRMNIALESIGDSVINQILDLAKEEDRFLNDDDIRRVLTEQMVNF